MDEPAIQYQVEGSFVITGVCLLISPATANLSVVFSCHRWMKLVLSDGKRKRAAEPAVEEEDLVEEVIYAIARFNEALEGE